MTKNQPARDFVTRGRLAEETGVHAESIRYYEQIGLLPAPRRSAGGYRLYDRDACSRLRFIRRGRELGFGIAELRSLLGLVDGGHMTCGEVYGITAEHLETVRAKIAKLRRLERSLAGMAARCARGGARGCPVIDALFDENEL